MRLHCPRLAMIKSLCSNAHVRRLSLSQKILHIFNLQASGCNEMQQEASLEWSVEAEYSPVLEAISAEGEKPAIEKSVGKSFVLRPVPEVGAVSHFLMVMHIATARLISPLPPGEHRLRSARSRNSTTAIGVLGRATSAVTDRTQREVNHKMSRKFPTSPFISEKKREQNRSAAIRYRDTEGQFHESTGMSVRDANGMTNMKFSVRFRKLSHTFANFADRRREEAKRKKEELHELELRNVALKTQVSGLSKEIGYLRGILNEMLSC
uniref:BZIP domain-containing protein n=1 Tax=Parascaris equorum TaxID=6256 RepID=A0A914R7G3_PAREQ